MAEQQNGVDLKGPTTSSEIHTHISLSLPTPFDVSYSDEDLNSQDNVRVMSESIVEIKYEYPDVKHERVEDNLVDMNFLQFNVNEPNLSTPGHEDRKGSKELHISSSEGSQSPVTEEDLRSYNLRPRMCNTESKIVESESSDSETEQRNRTVRSSEPFHVTSLSLDELQQLVRGKGTTKYRRNCWKVETSKLNSEIYNCKLEIIFKKHGRHLQNLEWKMDSMQEIQFRKMAAGIFQILVQSSRNLKKITLDYIVHQDVPEFIEELSNLHEIGSLKNLKFLRLNCDYPGSGISNCGVEALVRSGIPFQQLELEEFQRVESGTEIVSINNLLEAYKTKLTYLKIGRLYTYNKISAPLQVTFPRMKMLTHLAVSTTWDACSEKGQNKIDDFFQIKFSGHLPRLQKLNLGHFVKAEKIPFSILKNLKSVELENSWNHSVQFPTSVTKANATFLQFPNCLQDASFVTTVSIFFPYLKEVCIGFASQKVLHSFFTHFAASNLKHLSVEFQFGFPNMIESCLFPYLFHKIENQRPLRNLELLKTYKWREEFCDHYYLELPLDANYSNTSSKGLKGLTRLTKFHLSFIGREPAPIPSYMEELRWDDPNCKLLHNVTVGFSDTEGYPLEKECHEEILRINLDEYTWANLPTLDKLDAPPGYNILTLT